ncbi:MAG: AAA family ATPase, partial [Anaerolineae bacterium]
GLHSTASEIITRRGGMVAQYLGDGLLAFFGAQTASESDPENALRAALEIQRVRSWGGGEQTGPAAPGATSQSPGPKLELRIGIHTGLVVVGELGGVAHKEFTATGDAMNLAARLQSAAPPGGVLISHDTYRQVRGVFDVTPQPPLTVKGKSEPIRTYLVRRARERPFRMVTRGVAGIHTRTVGREDEIRRLQSAYEIAHAQTRMVWAQLIGEPGVGKSRLLEEIGEWLELRVESFRLLRARAYQGDAGRPFALVRRTWFDRFQIAEDAPLAQAEAKWVKGFQELAQTDEIEPAHVLGLLAGLPFENSPYIGAMRADPMQLQGRAFVVSRELLTRIIEQGPLVILVEDLHWADAASWEYLQQVVLAEGQAERRPAPHGVFVIATARPEWNPPAALRDDPRYMQVDLAPLDEPATRELAQELLGAVQDVPPQVVQMLIERSEGVPYYAEELVNWFIDRGIVDVSREPWRFVPARLEESPLPTTLQHLLLTRLSLLSPDEHAGLQRAAVFGRNFWEGGIETLGMRQPRAILDALQPRGFVERHAESRLEGEQEWAFRHALLRDVTYESLLKRERARLHRAAGDWLEEQARQAGRLDEFAGLLGEHAERAGETSAAVNWYLRAGERAQAQGAMREAKQFYSHVLELLEPADRERRWQALLGREQARAVLGERDAQADVVALVALARELGDDLRLAQALVRQSIYLDRTADYRGELDVIDEALTFAQRAGVLALEVRILAQKVGVLARLGNIQAARAGELEALARARALGDDATLAQVLTFVALRAGYSGDWAQLAQVYEEAAALWNKLGDRYQEALVLSNLGYVDTQLGLYRQARARLEQALRLNEAIGSRRQRAYSQQNLGLVYWRSGDGRRARALLDESVREFEAVGDTSARATSLLYLAYETEQSGNPAAAIARYRQAAELFAGLGAHSLEHDAVAGLARSLTLQGQPAQSLEQATALWTFLCEHGADGMDAPIWAFQTCADVFIALAGPLTAPPGASADQAAGAVTVNGKDLGILAREAIAAGERELMRYADKITNAEWRRSFLENVPEHQALSALARRPI